VRLELAGMIRDGANGIVVTLTGRGRHLIRDCPALPLTLGDGACDASTLPYFARRTRTAQGFAKIELQGRQPRPVIDNN
jgi:hypothetical protein